MNKFFKMSVLSLVLANITIFAMRTPDSETDLLQASARNSKERVKVLIKAGANVNEQHLISGQTPLILASYGSSRIEENAYEVVKDLCENGAKVDLQENCGFTPLHIAVTCGMKLVVRELLKHKANPNIFDLRKKTPLLVSTEYFRLSYLLSAQISAQKEIFKLLLQAGASPNDVDSDGNSPMKNIQKSSHLSDTEKREFHDLLKQHGLKE